MCGAVGGCMGDEMWESGGREGKFCYLVLASPPSSLTQLLFNLSFCHLLFCHVGLTAQCNKD